MSNDAKIALLTLGAILMWFIGFFLIAALLYNGLNAPLPPTGIYYASWSANFHPRYQVADYDNDDYDPQDWYVRIKGETTPAWKWWWTADYPYQNVSFTWDSISRHHENEDNAEGTINLHLPDMRYTSANGDGVLTYELLTFWLTGKNVPPSPPEKRSIDALMNMLKDAGSGQLPRPRHHIYHIEAPEPLTGGFTHFTLGTPVPLYTAIIWTSIWGCWVRSMIKRRREKKTVEIE